MSLSLPPSGHTPDAGLVPGHRPLLRRLAAILSLLVAALTPAPGATAEGSTVTIFAAISTREVVEDLAARLRREGAAELRAVYAASSTLARQVAAGAPAALYLSANGEWMDYLQSRGVLSGRPEVVAGNRLVLVAGPDSPLRQGLPPRLAPGLRLAERLRGERLALGDPDHVPVGIYAKAALESLGLWPDLEPRLAYANNARAVLALVEQGNAAAGIVYATDAHAARRARVVADIPEESHAPIGYQLAMIRGAERPEVVALYRRLTGDEGRVLFLAHGFLAPPEKARKRAAKD